MMPPSDRESESHHSPHQGHANASKITRGHSCLLCQKRKVRCDGQRPCSTCVRVNAECVVKPPLIPRPRVMKTSVANENIASRLQRYEKLLQRHGISLEDHIPESTSPNAENMGLAPTSNTTGTPKVNANLGTLIIGKGQPSYVEK